MKIFFINQTSFVGVVTDFLPLDRLVLDLVLNHLVFGLLVLVLLAVVLLLPDLLSCKRDRLSFQHSSLCRPNSWDL